MSLEEYTILALQAHLREGSHGSDMRHNDCVFDHLEGAGQSRSQIVPSETQVSSLQMEVETLKTKKQDLERNLKTSEEQIRQLRTSLKIGENVRNTMEKTIKDRTSKLEYANDENRKLTRSVKNAEEENRKLQLSVKNAEDENRKLTRSVKEAQDKVKSSENDLQTATGKNWKYYTDFKNADNRAKQLDHALQNASDKVKELERSLQETNHNFTTLKNSIHFKMKQNEISSLIQTNQQLNDDIKKIEHENVDLLLSLEKAQEILSSVSPYIVGGDKHHRTYLVPLEPQRNRTSITYKDEYEKKDLLVERFQRLNDALVESNILDKAIYDTFIGTFQKAITVLCEPKMPIKQRKSTLYRTYVKKDFIPTSEISKLKDLTIQSFSCFKSTVSVTKPIYKGFLNFDQQIHREFENILCIFQGILQKRVLHINFIQGYGDHVFWEMNKREKERVQRITGHIG